MAIKLSFKPKEETKKLLKVLPERSRDILERRYGLGKSVRRETLESVGRSYDITRERVRQIENSALNSLRKSDVYLDNQHIFTELVGVINELGGVVSEKQLLDELTTSEAVQNHLHFLLVLGDAFTLLKESPKFVYRWASDTTLAEKVHQALDNVYNKISKEELLAERDLIDKILAELSDIDETYKNENTVRGWLALSKRLAKNSLGEWGRVGSPGINMRGIRDMAWLVLKRNGSPMHYVEVANAIKETFGRDANSATTHNELIKDPRFVLVGRGLYALAEWGYSAGLVKDVLREILLQNGPMKKKDLIDAVKRERYVKTNTILINLQNNDMFKKDSNGYWHLADEQTI